MDDYIEINMFMLGLHPPKQYGPFLETQGHDKVISHKEKP